MSGMPGVTEAEIETEAVAIAPEKTEITPAMHVQQALDQHHERYGLSRNNEPFEHFALEALLIGMRELLDRAG